MIFLCSTHAGEVHSSSYLAPCQIGEREISHKSFWTIHHLFSAKSFYIDHNVIVIFELLESVFLRLAASVEVEF